jgi:hypothetical protein
MKTNKTRIKPCTQGMGSPQRAVYTRVMDGGHHFWKKTSPKPGIELGKMRKKV